MPLLMLESHSLIYTAQLEHTNYKGSKCTRPKTHGPKHRGQAGNKADDGRISLCVL